jgi:nucleoside 2-deoxyribosyltransferase
MVASPSDVASALTVVREALARWNVMHSEEKGVALLPMSWQTHSSPELGSPAQAVINRQLISRSDLLIAVFWTRLGTRTDEADSGTIEEILKHIEQGKPVMLYFCEKDVPFSQLDHDQHAKLEVFRLKVEGLYDTFKTDDQLHEKVERHLNEKLREHPYFAAARAKRSAATEAVTEPEITQEALELLIAATHDPSAQILRVQTNEGVVIGTQGKGRPSKSARDSAKNEGIINELEGAGFIEDRSGDRGLFYVTIEGFNYVDQNRPPPTSESEKEPARRTHFLELSNRLPDIVGSSYLQQCWLPLQLGLSNAESGAGFGLGLEESGGPKHTRKELLDFVSNGMKTFELILPPAVEPLIKSLANLAQDSSPEEQKNFRNTIHGTIPPGLAIWVLLDALRRGDSDLLDAIQVLGVDSFAITSFVPMHPKKTKLDDLTAVLARPG